MGEKYNLAVKRDRLTKQEKELVIKSYREAVNIGDVLMENINLEIQRQVEERIRIQRIKNLTRACKDKLYEIAANNRNEK